MLFLIHHQTEVNSQNRTGNLNLTAVHRKKKIRYKYTSVLIFQLEEGMGCSYPHFHLLAERLYQAAYFS